MNRRRYCRTPSTKRIPGQHRGESSASPTTRPGFIRADSCRREHCTACVRGSLHRRFNLWRTKSKAAAYPVFDGGELIRYNVSRLNCRIYAALIASRLLKKTDSWVAETPAILATLKELVATGFKPLDALHLAWAQALDCQYFLTVDKGILKKAQVIAGCRVLNPIEFVIEQGL